MLSYSAVLPYEKATLPSVEMWNTNMNILRDPPKGIFTRRKDKVGDTQQILLQQDDAGSRINEFISVYAKNVNPMVGVSYNNYGNSQRSGGGRSTQATLPYKIDVVRPPILSQYDLQPLSRLPRDWFYASTNPEFPSLVQNLQCGNIDKNIENFNLRSNLQVSPNKNGLSENFTDTTRQNPSSRSLKTPLEYQASTVKTSNIHKNGKLMKDLKSVRQESLLSKDVMSNHKASHSQPTILQKIKKLNTSKKPKSSSSFLPNLSIKANPGNRPTQYVSTQLANRPKAENVSAQKSFTQLHKPRTSIQEMYLSPKVPHHSIVSNQSSYQQTLRSDNLPELDRKLPMTEDVNTRKLFNFDTPNNIPNRQKQLLERLSSYGAFDNPGSAIPNPSGVQERHVSTTSSIDNSRSQFRVRMQEHMPSMP